MFDVDGRHQGPVVGELVEERMSNSTTTTSESWNEDEASFPKRPKVCIPRVLDEKTFICTHSVGTGGQESRWRLLIK